MSATATPASISAAETAAGMIDAASEKINVNEIAGITFMGSPRLRTEDIFRGSSKTSCLLNLWVAGA